MREGYVIHKGRYERGDMRYERIEMKECEREGYKREDKREGNKIGENESEDDRY